MKLSALIAVFLFAFPAYAHKPHVHGEGRLDVAILQDTITLDLKLPLEAVVGFERAPRNDKERAALANAEKLLNDPAALWQATPAANCVAESTKVIMPKLEKEGHVDVEARYVFRCAQAAALRGVEAMLFRHFKRLHRIETQRTGPTGQGARRLTPNNPRLTW